MKWQPIDISQDCDACGGSIEVLTNANEGECYDGDSIACIKCGLAGWISVYEDGDTLIHYDDE